MRRWTAKRIRCNVAAVLATQVRQVPGSKRLWQAARRDAGHLMQLLPATVARSCRNISNALQHGAWLCPGACRLAGATYYHLKAQTVEQELQQRRLDVGSRCSAVLGHCNDVSHCCIRCKAAYTARKVLRHASGINLFVWCCSTRTPMLGRGIPAALCVLPARWPSDQSTIRTRHRAQACLRYRV